MKKDNKLFLLFFTMLKIGAMAFGGGYVIISFLETEFIQKKKWIEKDEFLDMVALSEATPGPIAINTATYIGYKEAGFSGALISTVAMCIPSFVIIFLISLFFDKFLTVSYIANAFKGIQICVLYLILSAGFKMFKGMKKSVFNRVVFFSVIIIMLSFSLLAVNFSTIFCILISGFVGLAVHLASDLKNKGKGEK